VAYWLPAETTNISIFINTHSIIVMQPYQLTIRSAGFVNLNYAIEIWEHTKQLPFDTQWKCLVGRWSLESG
jgi:hypothetical protein